MATVLYRDRWISCTTDGLEVRGYYFPFGTKRIAYGAIRGVEVVPLTAIRGRWRIWGTSDFRHWFNLDPRRPRKQTALVLDLGAAVQPVITPDDPDAVAAILAQQRGS